MSNQKKDVVESVIDKVTGKSVPNIGAEENRQLAEQTLLDVKGYLPEDIAVDYPVSIEVNGEMYDSALDLLVSVDGRPLMVIKCVAGSLGSREKEVIASARVCLNPIPPLAVSTDGTDWLVWNVSTGKSEGQGIASVPTKEKAAEILLNHTPKPLEGKSLFRERLIFRSYDMDNVNVARKG